MATKIIQSRIQNKVDSYDNWMKSESPLLDGEIAIVRVPTGETYINPTTGEAEPEAALLMKVGDGTSSFAKLRWMCAKASDVYEWAKADPDVFLDWLTVTKKIASLNEVDKRIKAKVDIGDQTVTKYIESLKLAKASDLSEKADSSTVATLIGSDTTKSVRWIANDELKTQLLGEITEVSAFKSLEDLAEWLKNRPEEIVKTDEVINKLNTKVDIKDGQTVTGYINSLDLVTSNALSGILANKADKSTVTKLIGEDADKSIRTIANEELAKQLLGENNAEDNFKTLQELAAWLEAHPEEVAEINLAIQNLRNKVNGLENSFDESLDEYDDISIQPIRDILDLGEHKNVSEYVEAAIANYDTDSIQPKFVGLEGKTINDYVEDYVRDNSVQSVTKGEKNGTIKVDGEEVMVHGLGGAAYKNEDAFDAAGTADTKKSEAIDAANEYTDNEIDGLSIVIEAKEGVDHIVLKDKAGTEIASVNASKFVQDSFLNDVKYNAEASEIEFTWAMGDGSTKTDKITVADFVQTYTNGEGLILKDNMFSVDTATIATVQALEDAITNLGIENILSIVEQKSQVQIITWEEDD